MTDQFVSGPDESGENGPSPRQIIESIVEQGKTKSPGLGPCVEALSFARRHRWRNLEAEQYARLGVLLVQLKGEIDPAAADGLLSEIARTELAEDVHVVLRTLLAAMGRLRPHSAQLERFAGTFEAKLDEPPASWHARLMLGGFLDRLRQIDPALWAAGRARVTKRMVDWVIEYHVSEAGAGFDLRTRAIFNALMSAAWGDSSADNVTNGLDGAFNCAVDRLAQAGAHNWFRQFVEELTARLAPMTMYRRLTGETLFRVAETLAAARGQLYQKDPESALAITSLEEAIHRPHRRQLERSRVRMELEVPGPRGFGRSTGSRLRVFDISRDGCLAVTEGPAQFQETAPAVEASLQRGPGRACSVRRLSGVVEQPGGGFTLKPGIEIILHESTGEQAPKRGDASLSDRSISCPDSRLAEGSVPSFRSRSPAELAIDGASVVRVTPDEKNNRLWLGFHFDRVMPEVRQELEALVYGAA